MLNIKLNKKTDFNLKSQFLQFYVLTSKFEVLCLPISLLIENNQDCSRPVIINEIDCVFLV